jgi:hypothetical protein
MLIVLQGQTEKMMLEETKNYLNQLVIDLHYKARVEQQPELRKIADDISDVLKKDREECYT